MPILEKCCCCVNLKKGSMIIAILSVIGSAWNLISCSVPVGYGKDKIHDIVQDLLNRTLNETQQLNVDIDRVVTICWVTLIIGIVISAIQFLISFMLIYGIKKGARGLMLPWIVTAVIGLVMELALVMTLLLTANTIMYIFVLAVPYIISVHFFLVVLSYYQKLRSYEQLINPPVIDDRTNLGYGSILTI